VDLEEVYFDRYQRFRAAAELLAEMFPGQRLDLLDIGGFDDAFREFVPEHRITAFSGIISQGNKAPFADVAFDVSIALDVLEHVASGDRQFFLSEIARVARLGCLVSFPAPQAREAEEFVWRLTGSAWLAEHKIHDLPDPGKFETMARKLGLSLTKRPSASLPSWTAMMLLMHGVDKPLRHEISAFFNRHFYQTENREPAYRYIYFCRKD
jgi:SAM-dependent methyltransferase